MKSGEASGDGPGLSPTLSIEERDSPAKVATVGLLLPETLRLVVNGICIEPAFPWVDSAISWRELTRPLISRSYLKHLKAWNVAELFTFLWFST